MAVPCDDGTRAAVCSWNYSSGEPIVRFFPNQSARTGDLELEFLTRASQTCNINYVDDGEIANAISNVAGTNGPTYQHILGLPGDLILSDVSIEWIGDSITLDQMI